MTYETLKSIFENSYPGKKEIFEKLVSPIFIKVRDLTSSDRDFSTEVDSSKIKSCTIFAQVGGAFPITFADVELKENVSVKTNRVAIQNCVRRILDNNTNAIIFFHQPESTEWRVSYVHRGASNKDSTNAKRYTYLCGKNHACRTVSERFLELTTVTRINDEIMLKAFSIATLSDEFFDEYKVFYEDFVQFITGNRYLKKGGKNKWEKIKIHEPNKDIFPQFIKIAQKELNSSDEEIIIPHAQKLVRDYIKKLMGRLVFLQFLQKRGWLGVPKNKNWGDGDKNYIQNLFSNSKCKDDFLDKVLETLFFDTLNTKRDNDICESILGNEIKIPYLNGGLFEKDMIFDSTNIKFPKEFFSNPDKKEVERKFAGEIEDYPYTEYSGILDFFGKFNFTIDETDPYDQEIGVDPEMLGKIFENLLEDNKDKGAFYTPKEIVQYMCRESLIAYLLTDSQIEGDKIRDFVINHTDNFLDEEKTEIKEKLENVKICDPAVGSGAFPMGMLNELYACRHTIEEDTSLVEIKKQIVRDNIYGVDIEKGAVDIARLRFWLAIIVDETEPLPLPNLDYKIMQGNSLLECYEGIDLSNLTKREELSGKGKDLFNNWINLEDQLKELKNSEIDVFDYEMKRYFDINNHAEKKQAHETISEIVRNRIIQLLEIKIKREREQSQNLDIIISGIRNNLVALKDFPNDPAYIKLQKELDKNIAEQKEILRKIHDVESKQKEIEGLSYENNQFFLWHTWFNDVFNRPNSCNGGFDIVIGNPPYRIVPKDDKFKNLYDNKFVVARGGKRNLYHLFFEQGISLLKKKGILSYITPDTYFSGNDTMTLREYLVNNTNIKNIIHYTEKDKVFENVTQAVAVIVMLKQNHGKEFSILVGEKTEIIKYDNLSKANKYIFKSSNSVIDRMERSGQIFSDVCDGYQGEVNLTQKKDYIVEKRENNTFSLIRGIQITKYGYEKGNEYCSLDAVSRNHTNIERIVFQEVSNMGLAHRVKGTILNNVICGHSTNYIFSKVNGINNKYILSVLNSTAVNYYFKFFNQTNHVPIGELKRIPFPIPKSEQQKFIINLADKILVTKKDAPQADTSVLEHQIDLLVYHLYGLTFEEAKIIDENLTEEEFTYSRKLLG